MKKSLKDASLPLLGLVSDATTVVELDFEEIDKCTDSDDLLINEKHTPTQCRIELVELDKSK